jgi:hypothetical protein
VHLDVFILLFLVFVFSPQGPSASTPLLATASVVFDFFCFMLFLYIPFDSFQSEGKATPFYPFGIKGGCLATR